MWKKVQENRFRLLRSLPGALPDAWMLGVVGLILGAAWAGGAARASSPLLKNRIQPLLSLTAQGHSKNGVIYRGDLKLVLSPDQKEIVRLRYSESTKNLLSLKTELYSADFEPKQLPSGAALMEFTSRPVISLKANHFDSRTGGSLVLIITRDQRKGDTRALHLKLSRSCSTCPFELNLDENGETASAARMHAQLDMEAGGIRKLAIARNGNRRPLVFEPENDLRHVAR